jgi:hypothetical protein
MREAATRDIGLTREHHADLGCRLPQRAASDCQAHDSGPRHIPQNTIVAATQMTRPQTRFAEAGERTISLIGAAPPAATYGWFKQQDTRWVERSDGRPAAHRRDGTLAAVLMRRYPHMW